MAERIVQGAANQSARRQYVKEAALEMTRVMEVPKQTSTDHRHLKLEQRAAAEIGLESPRRYLEKKNLTRVLQREDHKQEQLLPHDRYLTRGRQREVHQCQSIGTLTL